METIEIEMPGDGVAEAYVARPAGGGEHPGVLFFMDAIGLRPRIAEMCQRIADWGYVVLAPNVFHRDGRATGLAPKSDLTQPGERDAFFAQVMPRVRALTADLAEQDLPVYLAALRDLQGVEDGPVGVTGYCMGARLSVRAACLDPEVAAVGGFHGGGLVTDADDSPHLGLGKAQAEFVFGHADNDRSMSVEAVAPPTICLRAVDPGRQRGSGEYSSHQVRATLHESVGRPDRRRNHTGCAPLPSANPLGLRSAGDRRGRSTGCAVAPSRGRGQRGSGASGSSPGRTWGAS